MAGKFEEILVSVESCLPKYAQSNFISEQEKSDVVHDLLAFLAEQMLKMNRQKQSEIKGFLGWLEGEIGAKVEDLTPKNQDPGIPQAAVRRACWPSSRGINARLPLIQPGESRKRDCGPSSLHLWTS